MVVLLSAESLFELLLNVIFLGKELCKAHNLTFLVNDSSLVLSDDDGEPIDLNLILGSLLLHRLLHAEDFVVLGRSDFLAILGESIDLRRVRSVELFKISRMVVFSLIHVLVVVVLHSLQLGGGFLL